ncbi:Lrp/AsnC family transcriptional regulator [Acinetobacter larvae]|uniref:Transcription regulator AsnC/Lrp ligand binding domain-containing protein n=1 Tax=Acinetobacter larvae TaxID=1789224 RepID=A0A1B2LY62_9GAMM|nr:Lrp/AsnC family transcriptional regulator [Acinetobacter larvae]AOA57892.1 hypothetical protein BFG52_05685 [Acinetobacter larvae]
MNELLTLDEIDIACMNALMQNPRGSWRELSLACDIPEKKLSRRISKLIDDQIIRTSIELNPIVVNKGFTVHVWMSVKFGKEQQIAQFLAQRPEVRIVFLTTGLADIFLEIGLEKQTQLALWMQDFVAQIPDIHTVETQVVLKPFSWASKPKNHLLNTTTAQKIRHITADERSLIHVLSHDGRISIKSLAEQIGMTEHKTQKLLNDLLQDEVFNIRIDFEPSLLGFNTEAIILVQSRPEHAQHIAQALTASPYTRCLFGMSGEAQFFWHVLCKDQADLWQLTIDELGQLEGIQSYSTNMITNAYKRAGFMRKGLKIQLS